MGSPPSFRVVSFARFVAMICRSLFVLLSFFFSPLQCLAFFHLRILITLLVSSKLFCVWPSSIYGFWLPFWYLQSCFAYISVWSRIYPPLMCISVTVRYCTRKETIVIFIEPYKHVKWKTMNACAVIVSRIASVCLFSLIINY